MRPNEVDQVVIWARRWKAARDNAKKKCTIAAYDAYDDTIVKLSEAVADLELYLNPPPKTGPALVVATKGG